MKATPTTPDRDRADRARDQAMHARPAIASGDAVDDGEDRVAAALAVGHHEPRDEDRREQQHDFAHRRGRNAEHGARDIADLRLQRRNEARQVRRGPAPGVVELLSDQGPTGDGGIRRRERETLRRDRLVGRMDMAGKQAAEHSGRHADDQKRDEDDDRGGDGGSTAQAPGDSSAQGVERHGENQAPEHQRREGREDPDTDQNEQGNEADADEDLDEVLRKQAAHRRVLVPGCHLDSPAAGGLCPAQDAKRRAKTPDFLTCDATFV